MYMYIVHLFFVPQKKVKEYEDELQVLKGEVNAGGRPQKGWV